MRIKNEDDLYFTLDDGTEIHVEAFVLEKSVSVVLAGYDIDETEDETIARHLLKAQRLWVGSPPPHLILPELPSRNGGLPPYAITAWLRSGMDRIVVVVHVDMHSNKSIQDIFQMYMHQINWNVLVGIDQEGERKMFEWYSRN